MTNIVLKSARGVNYSRLQQLLAAGNWKEADKETRKVMLQVVSRESKRGWLKTEDIDNFPCEDLQTIDQLWLHYSQGKFGFSVQKEIYESLGGTRGYNGGLFENFHQEVWKNFGDLVGWRKRGKWLSYRNLTFNNAAPKAHFPFLFYRFVVPPIGIVAILVFWGLFCSIFSISVGLTLWPLWVFLFGWAFFWFVFWFAFWYVVGIFTCWVFVVILVASDVNWHKPNCFIRLIRRIKLFVNWDFLRSLKDEIGFSLLYSMYCIYSLMVVVAVVIARQIGTSLEPHLFPLALQLSFLEMFLLRFGLNGGFLGALSSRAKDCNLGKSNAPVTSTPLPKVAPTPLTNFTEKISKDITLEMVGLPAGQFIMGSPDSDPYARDWEKPPHQVQVNGFAIGKYSVTQAQYEAVMGTNPSRFQNNPQNPVEKISWNDAQAFCRKLSQITGKTYRLPTEAEWEYACRAGTTTRFYFGDDANQLGDYAWYKGNSQQTTHPVGQKKPNAWGLYDMSGNVWEWCEDDWHDNYIGAPKDGSAWLTNDNDYPIVRGGCWYNGPDGCRSAYRFLNPRRDGLSNSYGFRVVCGAERTL